MDTGHQETATPQATGDTDAAVVAVRKRDLRRRLLGHRRELSPQARKAAGAALTAAVLALPELPTARTVAAYASVGAEPPTTPLLAALLGRGARVLLPVLSSDLDLDWAAHPGPDGLRPGPRGVLEPPRDTPRLGTGAVREADIVIVPGLAVGADGVRLGRGGGSYDRALARLASSTTTVVLLYDGELLDAVPREPHDRAVHVAVTPTETRRFAR